MSFIRISTCLSCLGFFGIVLGSTYQDFYGRRYDHYHGKYSDSELMVDVFNNFGLRILMVHNINNENNIAFSPYGIGVILIALGEGLRGEALYELRKALYLPYDGHTIRVGLRDIHRHLKSYFIPKEGFLAGITLNVENVSINPEYIHLLKFYGYDINSFNTALYPDKHLTTTESGAMDGREETMRTTPPSFAPTSIPETTERDEEIGTTMTATESVSSTSQTNPSTESPFSTSTLVSSDTTLQTVSTTESITVLYTNPTSVETTTQNMVDENVETTTSTTSPPSDVTTEGVDVQSLPAENTQSTNVPTTTGEMDMTSTTVDPENTETTTPTMRDVRSSEENLNDDNDNSVVDNQMGAEDNTNNVVTGNWTFQINNEINVVNSSEDLPTNTVDTTINNERRNRRSPEEYVISRYYHFNHFRPTNPYTPNEPILFHVNENTKEAGLDFMTYDTVLPFLYLPNPSAMALAFPLDSDKYYLLLMMPTDAARLNDLICKLYVHNTFRYILNNLHLTHVRVNIPSFNLNGRISLTNTLQKLGIRRIFEPRQADFSPMTSTDDVYVTNIEQSVSITIKNNLNIRKDARHSHYYLEPVKFDVNRPFLYFVIDSELQIILMAGKVVNPLNVRIN